VRFLSHNESAAWCRKHVYPVNEGNCYGHALPQVRDNFDLLELLYPDDSGKKIALARHVMRWFQHRGELLLWIDEWGVWPSCEHMPLFVRYRQAFGEARPLIEAPGHLVEEDEFDDGLSVLAVAVLFIWDCHVLSAQRGPVFFCSHDEWTGFFIPRGYDTERISQYFSDWLPDKKVG
jgi:hypothetical protein